MVVKKKMIIYGLLAFSLVMVGIYLIAQMKKSKSEEKLKQTQHTAPQPAEILYYTCGMHPSVRVSVEEYNKGKTKDPLCGMDLVPVYKKEEGEENVVKLSSEEVALAGIETFQVKRLPLFKEIRTVGVVAFDPELRTAEEEYIQALVTYQKISHSSFQDAERRAKEILDAARLKLELLGLTEDWIEELEKQKIPHKSLILPAEYMWVYADIYEYESIWPKIGDEVEIVSQANPGIILRGQIRAIEPVLKEDTRTLKLKILLENREGILKPNMYVDVFLKSELGEFLSIPKDAVLDTGKRKIAFVDLGGGRYQLREVKIGPLAEALLEGHKMEFYSLVAGVEEGEKVVLKGNYLLDSQSQLGAAGAVYGGALETKHKH